MFMIDRHGSPAAAIFTISTRTVWLVYCGSCIASADQIVTGDVDILRPVRVELSGQVAREDRAVHRLVAQLDAHFGAVAIDQFGGLLAADQRHVVTGHQKLGRQQ